MIKKFLLTIIIIIGFNFSYSQDIKENVEKSVHNLSQKLLLNEDQVNSITSIMNEFFLKLEQNKNDSTSLIKQTNEKIESYLDKKQKIKFDVIKSDWWNKLLGKRNTQQDEQD
ncbi:MAG: hypothetical protein N2043_00755 [Ignavibacterium sp.]|nr:hypothetical protein [Ignavibacterium sp.]